MAITDNIFTRAEFEAAVTANPTLLQEVRTSLTTSHGMTVRTADEETTFKTNFKATEIADEVRIIAQRIEADVLTLTGIPKTSQDEKYFDYLKRAVDAKTATLNDQITAATANADVALKQQNESLIEANKKAVEDLAKFTAASVTEINKVKVDSAIEAELNVLRQSYKPDMPKVAIEAVEAQVKAQLQEEAKVQDNGKVTFMDKEGKIIQNQTTFEPMTMNETLTAKLKDILDPTKAATGAGTGATTQETTTQEVKTDKGEPSKYTGLPSTVKSKMQLTDHLLSLGIAHGTTEFDNAFAKDGAGLPLGR